MTDKPAAGKTGQEEEVAQQPGGDTPEGAAQEAAEAAAPGAAESAAPQDAAEAGADEASPAEEAPRELTLADLQAQVAEALEQVSQYRDQALRAEAEMQNVRRRVQRDVENAHKFGIERFLVSLLPVVDSLEKAIESAHEDEASNRAIIEGMEICLKMLMDTLGREHVVQLDPVGEPFNPEFHEAIQTLERDDMEPNSVAIVIQKGYTLNERLVRPAMVIVSREPAPAAQGK